MTPIKEVKQQMKNAVNTPSQSTLVVSEWCGDDFVEVTLYHSVKNGFYYNYVTPKIQFGSFQGDVDALEELLDEITLQVENNESTYDSTQKLMELLHESR